MYYKEKQNSLPDKNGNKLWHPTVVRTGKTVDTRQLSKLISTATTLTEADLYAAFLALPQFMNVHLKEGHTVRLNGLGTFTVYGRSKGKGVENKDNVRPSQFTSLVCKFTPEYFVSAGGNRTRALLDDVEFINVSRLTKSANNSTDSGNNDGGNPDDDGGGDDWQDPDA